MANATDCNLRPPDAAPVILGFNYDAHTEVQIAQPVHCHFIVFLLLSAYTLHYAVTFDLEHLQLKIADIIGFHCYQFSTQSAAGRDGTSSSG